MPCHAITAVLLAGMILAAQAADTIPLRFTQTTHSVEVRDLGQGVWEVQTTGGDPWVVCERVTQPFDHETVFMFSFEYQCEEGLDGFQVYVGPPFRQGAVYHSETIPPTTEWRLFAANLKTLGPDAWNETVTDLRLDFGNGYRRLVRVRNLRLRAMTPEEAQAEEARLAEERRRLEEAHRRIEATMIAPARLDDTEDVIAARAEFPDDDGFTAVAVVGRELDLATQLREFADDVPLPVPSAPAIVAGEGPSARNHTLVRILNHYGICEVQFLAFPPHVRGGVQVAAGLDAAARAFIAAAPLGDATVRAVRVFSRYGNLLAEWEAPASVGGPFALAVGRFIPGAAGEQIALAPARPGGPANLAIMDTAGTVLAEFPLRVPLAQGEALTLATDRDPGGPDRLLVYIAGAAEFHSVDPMSGAVQTHAASLPPETTGVYRSAFGDAPHVASLAEPLFSHVLRIDAEGTGERVNVGERENLFWFTADGHYSEAPEGRFVRHSRFAHIRTDFGSPRARDPDFSRTDEEYWAGPEYEAQIAARLARYDTDPPTCWEPCFTHRWFYEQSRKWAEVMDEETGLPAFILLDRDNEMGTYGEFGQTRAFRSGTYAPGVAAIEAFYTYPLRAFLHGLVRKFRDNPEHFVAVEPNHEMEINAESPDTHGDYNPNMIRAFCRYLRGLHGSLDNINRVFGTPFTGERFDAPRDLQRGAWDAYTVQNPYYMAWMRFMNYVIYRVVAGTYREALLAGFPPEAIKCHQIPDHYAIASLAAFSKPARRITPIDWNLTAGVGFGCTKYGVWFNHEHNCIQGPNSSGFDAIVMGEYQSLTPDADLAFRQLEYLQESGVQFIHCMNWPETHDRGYNRALAEALARLVEQDRPRPGQTGGTGQVRAVNMGRRAFDIVCIGASDDHTGLLKSVNADGTWEGSVYVVPFHAHVAVEDLVQQEAVELGARPLGFGPFEGIDHGNALEFSFHAQTAQGGEGAVSLRVYHHGTELTGARLLAPVGADRRHYRLLVRVQIDTDDLRVELAAADPDAAGQPGRSVTLRDLSVTRQTQQTTRLKKGVFAGQRHGGAVTFDVLPDAS